MSTQATIHFFKAGTVQREDTSEYTDAWLKHISQPGYLQQHDIPTGAQALHWARLFDATWMSARRVLGDAWTPDAERRWWEIFCSASTELQNMSGLIIDEALIEQVLRLYLVITSLLFEVNTTLPALEQLLDRYVGCEFYISVD